MTIFIGADHRGFELKNKIVDYLHEKNIRVDDMGAYELKPLDNAHEYAKKVAEAVLQNPKEFIGIVICGSGIAVSIAANRYHGIRCALGFSVEQAAHAKTNDHANVLAIPAEYLDFEQVKTMIDTFINTQPNMEKKYVDRADALDDR